MSDVESDKEHWIF